MDVYISHSIASTWKQLWSVKLYGVAMIQIKLRNTCMREKKIISAQQGFLKTHFFSKEVQAAGVGRTEKPGMGSQMTKDVQPFTLPPSLLPYKKRPPLFCFGPDCDHKTLSYWTICWNNAYMSRTLKCSQSLPFTFHPWRIYTGFTFPHICTIFISFKKLILCHCQLWASPLDPAVPVFMQEELVRLKKTR